MPREPQCDKDRRPVGHGEQNNQYASYKYIPRHEQDCGSRAVQRINGCVLLQPGFCVAWCAKKRTRSQALKSEVRRCSGLSPVNYVRHVDYPQLASYLWVNLPGKEATR